MQRVKIAVVRESRPGEARVAMVPELVESLRSAGAEVSVETGAGQAADFADDDYRAAGATVEPAALDGADVVASVQPLEIAKAQRLASGTSTVSFLPTAQVLDLVRVYRARQLTSFALELVPRISRSQPMDALYSQALVSGYRCAIVAAERLRRFFPLSMTAAGTVPPAQVVVLGAGVAGLQAIATAKRLGAVVKAYDVRAVAAEEIRSMGAEAITLELETQQGKGGYAQELASDRAERQRQLLAPYIAAADALITTAAVPGRRAPLLVTRAMVEQMAAGSVVVDLAAETGGNVEGSVPGEEVQVGAAVVWGAANLPSQMPGPASRLYAHNVANLIALMNQDGSFAPNFDVEIVSGTCVTHAGEVRHEPTRELLEGPAA